MNQLLVQKEATSRLTVHSESLKNNEIGTNYIIYIDLESEGRFRRLILYC